MEKQKFQGDWKCSGCGKAITELPFEPKNTENLTCFDCHKAKTGDQPKQKFQGDWKCSGCGGAITELPFEPKGKADNLKCFDCFKKG